MIDKTTISLIVVMFAAIGFFLILIWAEWSKGKILSEGHKVKSRLEYKSWRLKMISEGHPAPDTWEESERKLRANEQKA